MNAKEKQATDPHESACHWIARLSSDHVTSEDEQTFALWLAASPSNRDAFDEMVALLELLRP